jgi:RHS repeat-associated protein
VNELSVTETASEEAIVSQNFINWRGQTILERTGKSTMANWLDTYFIYDIAGNAVFVFPPEAMSRINSYASSTPADKQKFIDSWCYQYRYDEYNRIVERRVPGEDWVYQIYDKWDRVVLTQDGNQRVNNQWTYRKFDIYNRPIITGVTTGDRTTLKNSAANGAARFESRLSSNDIGYTNNCFPSHTSANIFVIDYYDDYAFLSYTGWGTAGVSFAATNDPNYASFTHILNTTVKGHKTGSKVKILNTANNTWLRSVSYYDKFYRSILQIAETALPGTIKSWVDYNFLGQRTKERIVNSYSSLTIDKAYVYDHASRLLSVSRAINGGSFVVAEAFVYNELGQVIEKNIHSEDNGLTFLQSVDQRYNIRGSMTHINNSALTADPGDTNPDLFGMEVAFNPPASITVAGTFPTAKYYDGKVSWVKWQMNNKKDAPIEKIYGFDYDDHGRFKQSYFATLNAGQWSGNSGMYNEQITSYDKAGNIGGVIRYNNVEGNKVKIDDLNYSYSLNGVASTQLVNINDISSHRLGFRPGASDLLQEYEYDKNGNLKFDYHKGISTITYNHLDLPTLVRFTRSNGTNDDIEYLYDGTGAKISRTIKINGVEKWKTQYAGAFQYDNGNTNNQPTFFLTQQGRAVHNNGTYDYEYFLKDHLGNTRVVFGNLSETVSYRATMEAPPPPSILGSTENSTFKNINSTRTNNVANLNINYTKSSSVTVFPREASETNAYTNKPIGPAKSITLSTGDKVHVEVVAKYLSTTGSLAAISDAALITAVATTTFGFIPGEIGYTSFSNYLPTMPGRGTASTTLPKAYLALIFTSTNNEIITSSAVAMSTSAFNAFEKLERNFTATQNGKLFIYVANESNTSTSNVYFDEMQIVHVKNSKSLQVTQSSDFYPFGLSFNEYHSERINGDYSSVLNNRYLFQGQESEKDLDADYYGFKARMYDPALGRWNSVDPLSEKFKAWSGYNFVMSNPISFIDPDGRHPVYGPFWGGMPSVLVMADQMQYKAMQTQMTVGSYFATAKNFYAGWYATGPENHSKTGESSGQFEKFNEGPFPYPLNMLAKGAQYMPVVGSMSRMYGSAITGDMEGTAVHGSLAMLEGGLEAGGSEFLGTVFSRYVIKPVLSLGTSRVIKASMYIPENSLAQQTLKSIDIPLPDPLAGSFPHTTLGSKMGSDGVIYRQSATFTGGSWPLANGEIVPWSRVDWSTRGRPLIHPNPHQHVFSYFNNMWQFGGPVPYIYP